MSRPNERGAMKVDENQVIEHRQSEVESLIGGTTAFRSQNDVKLGYKPFELEPSPIMSLYNRQGINTETGQISFSTDSTAIVISNKNLVCLSIMNGYQRFLIGHESQVSCFSIVPEENLIVSVDQGEQPEAIVWRIMPAMAVCRFKLEMKSASVADCCKFTKEGK
jgi:hypothetical protein